MQQQQPTPPAAVPMAHRGPSYGGGSHHDGPRVPPAQSKKPNAMMWSPGGSSVNDQPSYRQGQTDDVSSQRHVSAPRPAPGGQQFSKDANYSGHGGQDRGPPWQARDSGGGTWNQSRHGPPATASPQHHHHQPQQQQQQQQQRGRTQAQREYGNHVQPANAPVGLLKLCFIVMLIPIQIQSKQFIYQWQKL